MIGGDHQLWRSGVLGDLTPCERLVLVYLWAHRNGDGTAWPLIATITRDLGYGRTAVTDALRSLRKQSLIEHAGLLDPSRPKRSAVKWRLSLAALPEVRSTDPLTRGPVERTSGLRGPLERTSRGPVERTQKNQRKTGNSFSGYSRGAAAPAAPPDERAFWPVAVPDPPAGSTAARLAERAASVPRGPRQTEGLPKRRHGEPYAAWVARQNAAREPDDEQLLAQEWM